MTLLSLQKKSIPQKIPVGVHVAPQSKYILASPAAYVTDKENDVFDVDVKRSYIASQTCCRPTCLVTEMTRITCGLRQEDPCKISLWFIAVIRSNMTGKFDSGQTEPTADVANMFKLKSIRYQSQVQFPNCSFEDGKLDSPCVKFFTTIVDHFFPNWTIF